MLRIVLIIVAVLFLAPTAQAEQAQFFPPSGPCNAENPILAWNGSGSTYCTHFPTATLPDCKDGEFLTKKNGTLVCSNLTGTTVTAPTTPAPTAPTTTTPTTTTAPTNPYNSDGTPTGIPQRVAATGGSPRTIANPVVRTGNATCPSIYVPVCASDSVLVDYGLDYNGCQTSPQCYYVGYGNAAATYAASGYSAPAYLDTPYVDAYVDTYVEPIYVEPYVETAPVYDDEPYYAPYEYGDE